MSLTSKAALSGRRSGKRHGTEPDIDPRATPGAQHSDAPDEQAHDRPEPRRVLIVSASMGEGHNATGRALQEAVGRLWPKAHVQWADVLTEMGYGAGPLFRWIYATSVRRLPWLYEFFYGRVWRYRWFARASKRVIGAWSGRKLGPVVDRASPDMILSTYPMATTGLEWLRRCRGLGVPAAAWISDFAPHPSWVHSGVDLNLVMHEVAVPAARRSEPRAAVAVSAPPVSATFRPGERSPARDRLDLPEAGFLAVVACGSLGFGRADRTVRELLDGDPQMCVVVVAGRNETLRDELDAGVGRDPRVRVLGWVDDMASLLVAADVVVTNAGGATFLEAMACGRTVLMHEPIAGHGRANAELMAEAGLARVCSGTGELAEAVRELRADPGKLAEAERAIAGHLAAHRLEDGLQALRECAAPTPARSLRPEDALFMHVHTATVPQQVGTVLVFDPPEQADDSPDRQAPTRPQVAEVLRTVPGITGHLRPARLLRRARWVPDRQVDPAALVDEVALDEGHGDLDTAIDEFFSTPLDPVRACGQARLVTGLPGGGRAVLVKLHHALGDGITVLRALLSGSDGAHRSWATPPVPPVGPGPRSRPKRLARGLWNLAGAGTAPSAPTARPVTSAARHHQRLLLPGDQLKHTARALEVTPSELLHAVFAEAVHRTFGSAHDGPSDLRLMVPWSLRGTGSLRAAGNSAGVLSADIPVGPLPPRERVRRVAAAIRTCADGGMPDMAGAVVRSFGFLPPPLHRLASRLVYRSSWFNAIGTVLPGPRWDVRLRGVRVSAAYPVLPLAPGVGLTWGAMTWGEQIAMCLTVSADLRPHAGPLAAAARAAFDEFSAAAAAPRESHAPADD